MGFGFSHGLALRFTSSTSSYHLNWDLVLVLINVSCTGRYPSINSHSDIVVIHVDVAEFHERFRVSHGCETRGLAGRGP